MRELGLLLVIALALAVLAGVGDAWFRVGVVYLAAVVFPGAAGMAVLRQKVAGTPMSFLEATLYANLVGATGLMAIGWTAARLGWFSSYPVTLAAVAVGLGLAAWGRRELTGQVRRAIAAATWDQFAVIAGVFLGIIALLTPVFAVLQTGAQIGGDTSFFTRIGDVIAQTGRWPQLSTVWQPYTSQADVAPGLPVLYAVFGGVFGSEALHLAFSSNVLTLGLATLSMFLLVKEFVGPRWVAYAAAAAWIVGFPDNSPIVNDILTAGVPGFYPDAVASISFFLLLAAVTVRLLRAPRSRPDQLALLAIVFLGIVLVNQLTFLMAVVLLVVAGLYLLVRAGPRWTLRAAVVVVLPVLAFLPEYLIPSYALADSPSTEKTHAITLATWFDWPSLGSYYLTFGEIGLIGAAAAVVGVAFALLWALTRRAATPLWDVRGAVVLAATGLIYLPLAFTPVGADLLGIGSSRFNTYLGLLSVPFIAVALVSLAGCGKGALVRLRARSRPTRVAIPKLGHTRSYVAVGLVVAIFVAGAAQGVSLNLHNEQQDLRPGLIFDSDMAEAAAWINAHAVPGAVVMADGNGGNSALTVFAVYCGHVVIFRPDFDLELAISQSAYPTNLPVLLTNTVVTNPNATNAQAAYAQLNVQYYVLQWGFSTKIIDAMSLLAYFPIVYENPQIVVFRYVPSLAGDAVFLPATGYSSASPTVVSTEIGTAYNQSNSIPITPNAITSTGPLGSAFNGSTANYSFTVNSGIYTLTIHREVYQTSEHIRISIDGKYEGTVYFTSLGWSFGALANLVLSPGPTQLTLTFEGTVGYMDPIDYLTLSQG